eukprot:evm.model.scf_121.3 EVM.evm.TU.scf_121.3   scf_121:21018-22188(-)
MEALTLAGGGARSPWSLTRARPIHRSLPRSSVLARADSHADAGADLTEAWDAGNGISRRAALSSFVLGGACLPCGVGLASQQESIYDFEATFRGKSVALSKYRGQVLVVVNVASE